MKGKDVAKMWASYAQKLLNTGVPVATVVRAMNLNSKHRAPFRATDTAIMFKESVVIDLPKEGL